MSIDQLFCTPEQGRRIAELVPELIACNYWLHSDSYLRFPYPFNVQQLREADQTVPALTLQELRDVAKSIRIRTTNDYWGYMQKILNGTATELAAWVIERLEEVER